MPLHTSRIPSLLARTSVLASVAALAAAGCNMPRPSSSDEPPSGEGAEYATGQQALEASGEEPDSGEGELGGVTPEWESYAGCDDAAWYLCFMPTLTVKWWSPPGEVTYSPKAGFETCIPIKASTAGGGSHGTLQIAIEGKAEDDDLACTIKGRTTVTLFVGYKCKGESHRGVMEISFKQQWGQAPATLSCKPKREGVNVIPDSIITLGTLGTQEDKLQLKLQLGDAGECQTYPIPGGPITGNLVYCLWSHTSYQPPTLPEVP